MSRVLWNFCLGLLGFECLLTRISGKRNTRKTPPNAIENQTIRAGDKPPPYDTLMSLSNCGVWLNCSEGGKQRRSSLSISPTTQINIREANISPHSDFTRRSRISLRTKSAMLCTYFFSLVTARNFSTVRLSISSSERLPA